MKQTAKKFLSVFLVVAMMFSLNITAFAGTITISETNDKHTYEAYQIFTGTLSKDGILTDVVWGDGVDGDALLTELKGIEAYSACEDAADVADVLGDFSDDDQVVQDFADIVAKHLTNTHTDSTVSGTTATIDGLDDGYYLVQDADTLDEKDEAATRYILEVVGATVVEPKSEKPTVEKKVLEDTDIAAESEDYADLDKDYNDVADWDIGETKKFLISANLPAEIWDYDTYKLIFHDEFSDGITIGTGYNVYYYVGNTQHTLDASVFTKANGTGTNEITFTCEDILDDIRTNANGKAVKIVITYDAILNENAVIGLGGNPNEVYLEYSNYPYGSGTGITEKDEVKVFTFEIEGTKIDPDIAGEGEKNTLEGAEFILGKDNDNDDVAYVWAEIDEGTSAITWTETKEDATAITSDANGLFTVKGLDADTYYLEETKAPDGYNLLKEPVEFTIKATEQNDGEIYNQTSDLTAEKLTTTIGTVTDGKVTFEVENKKGSTLPSTGDTGRTAFYAIGAMGFSLALIVLVTKKRMAKYSK